MTTHDYETALDAARTDLGLLNADELEVAQYFITKIIRGKAKHGPLDLDTDRRDWQSESCEERADDAAYSIMGLIQRNRERARMVEPPMVIDSLCVVGDLGLDFDLSEFESGR